MLSSAAMTIDAFAEAVERQARRLQAELSIDAVSGCGTIDSDHINYGFIPNQFISTLHVVTARFKEHALCR